MSAATDALVAIVHRGLTVRPHQTGLGQATTVTVAHGDTYSTVAVPPEVWADETLLVTLLDRMANQVRPRLDPGRLP